MFKFKEKEQIPNPGLYLQDQDPREQMIKDFKEKLEKGKKEEKKELTPEQTAEKKQKEQKEKEMFERLAKEALFKDLSFSNINFRQTAPLYIENAIKWLKWGGYSFKESKKWIGDRVKESTKEAKGKKDKKGIELCKELKGALRSFKEKE